MAADSVVEGSGALKRKLEEDVTQKTKDEDLSSPPAKIRATDDKTSEAGPTKPSVEHDVAASAETSNQTTLDSSSEAYDEREKMQ